MDPSKKLIKILQINLGRGIAATAVAQNTGQHYDIICVQVPYKGMVLASWGGTVTPTAKEAKARIIIKSNLKEVELVEFGAIDQVATICGQYVCRI